MWPASIWVVTAALLAGLTANAEARPPEQAGKTAKQIAHDRHFSPDAYSPADPDAVAQLQPLGSTPCVGGMAGPYPCKDVDLMSFLPLAQIGGGRAAACGAGPIPTPCASTPSWAAATAPRSWTSPTRPTPCISGNLPTHTGSSIWREMKAYGYYAYIISDRTATTGCRSST